MYKYISNFNVRFTAVDMEKEEEYHIDYDQYYSICNSSYMVRWRDYCIALFGKFWHLRQVSGNKYLNQMSTYQSARGDSEIT